MSNAIMPQRGAITRTRYRVRLWIRTAALVLILLAIRNGLQPLVMLSLAILASDGPSPSSPFANPGFNVGVGWFEFFAASGGTWSAIPWDVVLEQGELVRVACLVFGLPATYLLLAAGLLYFTPRLVNWLAPVPRPLCPQCSYEISGPLIPHLCPECGLELRESIRPRVEPEPAPFSDSDRAVDSL